MRLLPLMFVAGLLALSACAEPPPMKEYSYPAWGFAVSFRDAPKVTDIPATADGSGRHGLLVESVLAGRDNLVNVIDGTGSPKSEAQALDDAPNTLAKSVNGTLDKMSYAAVGKALGREFFLNRQGHQPARVRIYVWKQHLYELISESSLGPDDPETKAFLDSFRLL
jgi:hypothetical protein